MKKKIIGDYHRSISSIFSIPIFKGIFENGASEYVFEKVSRYRSELGLVKATEVRKILNTAYNHLTLDYRNEYIYKNFIANKLLLELHDLNEANIFNEFRIGSSISDVVIINGTNTIYEIKTELDSPDKLKKQIEDYRKVSPKVYLVTHHSLIEKYNRYLSDDSIGLISLTSENELVIVKHATNFVDHLNNKFMMDTLKKSEYSSIVEQVFGYTPQVSNIHFYKECQKLVHELDPTKFHELMLAQLRNRSLKEKYLINSINTPVELKHICLSFNPNKFEFQNLYNFLKLTI